MKISSSGSRAVRIASRTARACSDSALVRSVYAGRLRTVDSNGPVTPSSVRVAACDSPAAVPTVGAHPVTFPTACATASRNWIRPLDSLKCLTANLSGLFTSRSSSSAVMAGW